jgi:hypothetical protein
MSVLSDIADALDAKITDAALGLNVTAICGYPDYTRPDLTPPIAAYWLIRHEPVETRTISRVHAHRWLSTFSFAVYTQDEKRLCDYVSAYGTMLYGWIDPTISSRVMRVTTTPLERIEDESGTVQLLRYAAGSTITFEYEV